jgi:hypothetical protein
VLPADLGETVNVDDVTDEEIKVALLSTLHVRASMK